MGHNKNFQIGDAIMFNKLPSELNNGSYLGLSSIQFRNKYLSSDKAPNWIKGTYILNSYGDGWFRSDSGSSQGYGLCITGIKITSHNGIITGNGRAYKAMIDYTNQSQELEHEPIWLYVDNSLGKDELLEHINRQKKNWIP
jgi:hypothetical protein